MTKIFDIHIHFPRDWDNPEADREPMVDRLAEIGEDVEPLHPLVSDCDSRLAQARPVAAAIDASHWLWHPPFDQRGPK